LEAREGLFDDFQFLWSVERAINQLTSFLFRRAEILGAH
jgi:hypothetical protein